MACRPGTRSTLSIPRLARPGRHSAKHDSEDHAEANESEPLRGLAEHEVDAREKAGHRRDSTGDADCEENNSASAHVVQPRQPSMLLVIIRSCAAGASWLRWRPWPTVLDTFVDAVLIRVWMACR